MLLRAKEPHESDFSRTDVPSIWSTLFVFGLQDKMKPQCRHGYQYEIYKILNTAINNDFLVKELMNRNIHRYLALSNPMKETPCYTNVTITGYWYLGFPSALILPWSTHRPVNQPIYDDLESLSGLSPPSKVAAYTGCNFTGRRFSHGGYLRCLVALGVALCQFHTVNTQFNAMILPE
ncbi:hypothetical protein RF11_09901 [Thelohanellus kitauei]|uniref:Uncharacterized protein n=1 Tax=Thelohanellus kitauei TaxID=669202 RepID=A0A0C2J773_THEKT|nr:hypothetical protein RF11_09901 [Thelohanellus kitauei]